MTDTADILVEFDKKFIEIFQDNKDNNYSNDWIDKTICCYDKKEMSVSFSSAKRKLLYVSVGNRIIYKGCECPIGVGKLKIIEVLMP